LVSRRPMRQTEPFLSEWTNLLVKHSTRFLRFSPSREQVEAYLGQIPQREHVDKLRKSLG
jgi:hypothetical protein